MVFSFLNEDNIFDLYDLAKDHTEELTQNFDENARIARNKPHPKTPKRFPKTTDGTAASIIRKSSRRVVQQLPTGIITTDKENDKWPILADFKYRTEILPLANAEYDLIWKCWTTLENGQTFGSQTVLTLMLEHDGVVSPDYLLPYWGDTFYQPGKKSGYDCNYVFVRSWWQKNDVEELISDLEAMNPADRKKSGWSLEALREILDAIETKDEKARTPSETELSLDPTGIEIVTGFQVGKGAEFLTFNTTKQLVLRKKINTDPRGKTPLDFYYFDTDGSNPLGRSLLDLIGPLQNLIDSDMQAYQYNRALALQPPLNVYGNVNTKQVSAAPNSINRITDVNAKIEPMTIDTSAIRDYPNIYGLQKSQMLNLVASPDTSISAEVGNPGFGKTPTAIKTQNANVSVDDNAMRKSFEALWENWSETAINLHFSERSGKEEVQLDSETADRLRQLETDGHLEPGYVRDDNTVIIDYDEAHDALRFRIDASTSKVNTEEAQLEALSALVSTLDSSQALSEIVPQDVKLRVWNAIVSNSGVEDSAKLKVTEEELKLAQEQAQMMQQGGELPIEGQAQPPAEGQLVAPDGQPLDTGMQQEMPEQPNIDPNMMAGDLDDEDIAIANELRELGIPEDLIEQVPGMVNKGYSEDEIMASIRGVLTQRSEAEGEQNERQ